MRRVALVALAACHAAPGGAEPRVLAITGVTMIDGTGAPAKLDTTVVIRGDRITAVGAHADVPRDAQIVDGRGRFLIPGLWDLHVHLSKVRAGALDLLIASGVTGVRDMGGDLDELERWRREIATGRRIGPRIVTAGSILETADNVARMKREGTVEPVDRVRIPIGDPASAERAVDRLAARGVDFIKFRTVASVDVYRAIARAARARGLALAGHADQVPIDEMLAAGQRTLEHAVPLAGKSEVERAALYRRMIEGGVVVVPTAVVAIDSLLVDPGAARAILDDPSRRGIVAAYTLADWREQAAERPAELPAAIRGMLSGALATLREMHRAGVAVLPGTDTGVLLIYPGTSLHHELALLVRDVGLSPMEALVAATRSAAELVGMGRDLGTIEPGKLADLVLLDADPIADIAAVGRVHAVVRAGQLLTRDALDRAVAAVRGAPELARNDWR